jgi:hypothetical protein
VSSFGLDTYLLVMFRFRLTPRFSGGRLAGSPPCADGAPHERYSARVTFPQELCFGRDNPLGKPTPTDVARRNLRQDRVQDLGDAKSLAQTPNLPGKRLASH